MGSPLAIGPAWTVDTKEQLADAAADLNARLKAIEAGGKSDVKRIQFI